MPKNILRFVVWYSLVSATMLLGRAQDSSTPANDSQPTTEASAAPAPRGPQPKVVAHPIVRLGKDITAPRALSTPDANYSDAARHVGYQANVLVSLVVDTEGVPKDVRVAQGAGMGLDEQAIGAVKTWRFSPAIKDGQPVEAQMMVEVHFRMTDFEAEAPLVSPPEANATPPEFPGINAKKYPLVINVVSATGVPAGKTYEIVARATIDDAVGRQSLSIFCNAKKYRCPFLSSGHYPARWIAGNHALEILGKENSNGDWRRTEYTVKAE